MSACAVCVTIFITGSKFCPVSNFMELHALALAACSYVLLHYMSVIFLTSFGCGWAGEFVSRSSLSEPADTFG